MDGIQHSNDDGEAEAEFTAIAERYHEAAVHEYKLGHHEEAQRLARIALAHRAKAHACFLKRSLAADLADGSSRRARRS